MKIFIVVLHETYEPDGWSEATESNVMGVFDTKEKAEIFAASKPRVIVDGRELNYASSDYGRQYLIEEWEVK